jgi:ATP-dependent DNA helicase RecQ
MEAASPTSHLPQSPTDEGAFDPQLTLRQRFGFDRFKPGQQEVVAHLLAGRSSAAVFPTGGGKSLCYQLPALFMPGVTLVVSPLIALMKDQIDALAARGIPAQRLDSTLTADEYRRAMADVRGGRLRLLYVAPERFGNERFRETIGRTRVSLFAVDEAHCISEWGHNFRPDYLKLAQFAKACRAERVLALTATATDKVLDDVCRAFEIDRDCAVRTGFYRPNLKLLTTPVDVGRRDDLLVERLKQRPPGPAIIYVTLQRTAEELAKRLCTDGFSARPYHAGLEDDRRTSIQDWFLASGDGIVVATIAFGMGIDKADIRYIYHYNPPKSLENFAQEIGRAGRDGDPATCELFYCADDLNVLENFVYGNTPTQEAVTGLVEELFGLGPEFDVSYYELSNTYDIRLLVVRTLLCYLELLGYFEGGTPFYNAFRFKPRAPSAEILAQFDDRRRKFLADLFRKAEKAKTWFSIDTARAGRELGCGRERVVRALDYLGEQGWLELKVQGVRHRYRRRREPEDLGKLAQSLYRRTLDHEKRHLQRLNQVTELVESDDCQVSALGGHFGEPLDEPCGHCSWCLGQRKAIRLPKRVAPPIDEGVWRRAEALRSQEPAVLDGPRQLARFLCGVSSPWLLRRKLTKDPLFGAFRAVPFQTVLDRAAE